MKSKQGNVAVIALIVGIIAITASVIFWLIASKMQIPAPQAVTTQLITPVVKKQPAPAPQPAAQPASIDETVNWKMYSDTKYGFELKTPKELKSSYYEGSTGNGQSTIQLVTGDPIIKIMKNVTNLSKDPYGDASFVAEPQIVINGITWHVFYNSEGGKPRCDSAAFQTLMPNGKDVIYISTLDENNCPGNPQQASSVAYLKQVLSTFRFTEMQTPADWHTYNNDKYGFEITFTDVWKKYKAIETVDDKIAIIQIQLPTNDTNWKSAGGLVTPLRIMIFTKDQWAQTSKQAIHPNFIIQNNSYVFT